MIFFFIKQKTAYELRISDWSSDVCSSDLTRPDRRTRRNRECTMSWLIAVLLSQAGDGAEHFVGGLDHLRVHLVGTLRGDQIGDLADRVDVRGLDESPEDGAEAIGPRIALGGVAGCRGFQEQAVSRGLEARGTRDVRELEIAHNS